MTAYQQRVNAERLANQAPAVQKIAKELLDTLHDVERYLYWSIDPEENYLYDCNNLIEHAHILIDQAHEYRAALKANPPPKEEDGDDGATA